MADNPRRFDSIERVVRDTRRELEDFRSTALSRLGTHTHEGSGGGGTSDHGALNGLADDDHLQYLTQSRGDARYYTEAESDVLLLGKAAAVHGHAQGDVSGLVSDLAGKQPLDSDLTTIAGLTPADGDFMKRVSSAWAASTLVKGDVGLGNVDNTSDVAKPVSTAQQTALNGKANTSHTHLNSDISGVGATQYVVQTSDAVRTSSTAFSATDLTFSNLINGARYALEGWLVVEGAAAADISLGWGQLNILGYHTLFHQTTAATVATGPVTQAATSNFATLSVGCIGAGAFLALPILGSILVSGGSGVLGLQVAQAVSNATPSRLKAGSWLRITRTAM